MLAIQILLVVTGLASLFFLVRWRKLMGRQRRGRYVSAGQKKIQLLFCMLSFSFFLFSLIILIAEWAQAPSGSKGKTDVPRSYTPPPAPRPISPDLLNR